jgi:UDP-N-acetyl-D-glucosamine dehydrogenase
MELLEEKGAIVEYTDPYVPLFPKMRDHSFDLTSVNLTPEIIASYDILLLVTDHTTFDYEMIQQNAQLIVDTRGVYQDPENNVIKA